MPCLFGFVKESVLLKALLSSDRRDIDTNKFCKLDFCRVALAQFNQFHILEGVSKNNGNPKSFWANFSDLSRGNEVRCAI